MTATEPVSNDRQRGSSTRQVGALRRRFFRGLLVVLLGTIAASWQPARATEHWHSGVPKWIYTGTDGWIVITFPAEAAECPSTGTPKYMNIVVGANGVTASGAKQMLSVAMLAFATGKTLAVAYDDATPNCYINRVYIAN